jgi:asparagine synthetase B (glutamine-hydrolysing)
MFLFIADGSKPTISPSELLNSLPGRAHIVRNETQYVVWTEDRFTKAIETRGQVTVEVRRPHVDQDPVVRLHWDIGRDEVLIERRWSGEFAAYIAHRPALVLASHLRLVALLWGGLPVGTRQLKPSSRLSILRGEFQEEHAIDEARVSTKPGRFEYGKATECVRRLVLESVGKLPTSSALLLSGGVDSSVVAAAGKLSGKKLYPFVFGLKRLLLPQKREEDDFFHAQKMSEHLESRLIKIVLESRCMIQNVRLAVALAETPRGTIIDDCVALVEVARILEKKGFSTVVMGEAADDLFGGFKFALRYYKGSELQQYFMHELNVSLPNELCIIQKIFEPCGISVVQPYWTRELKRLAETIPLSVRVDSKRLMKRILRDAFSDILPAEIRERPKGVTRDTTQIRFVLEKRFGKSRERYRGIFNELFRNGFKWPQKRNN